MENNIPIAFISRILSMGILMIGCKVNTSNVAVPIPKTEDVVNNYIQIATGQTLLYDQDGRIIQELSEGDSLYGQDANYTRGKKMSYKKNNNGTVTDLNTGLMWQEVPVKEGFTWEESIKYCNQLNLAGYDDWRIPSAKELYSISNFSSGWPYLDTTYFSLATKVVEKHEQYWSNNKYLGVTVEGRDNSAFGVNHVTGHIKSYPAGSSKPNNSGEIQRRKMPPPGGQKPPRHQGGRPLGNPMEKHVRAVRGNIYGINNFIDNEDGTITDVATGLMWAKGDSEVGLNWINALKYAENSELAGYDDWRLPNVKELQGIVDYSYAPEASEGGKKGPAIDPLFSCTVIVNEAGHNDYAYYWTSTSARFSRDKPYYYAWYVAFGRAVNREGNDVHGAGAVRFDTKYDGGPLGEGGERYFNYVRLVRDSD